MPLQPMLTCMRQQGDADRGHLDSQVETFAQQAAAAEEARFTAALSAAEEHRKDAAAGSDASSQPDKPKPQKAAPRSSSAQSMREAALAKIAKARQYVAAQADASATAADSPLTSADSNSAAPAQPISLDNTPVRSTEWGRSAAGTSKQVSNCGPLRDIPWQMCFATICEYLPK